MSATVCVLASGSKGNCTYLSDGNTHLLIDAGISCRRVEEGLSKLGRTIGDIDAILLTHEHIDHTYGLVTIERRYHTTVLANRATAAGVDARLSTQISQFCRPDFDTGFRVGGVYIMPFRTMHDAACSVGYTFVMGGHRLSYVTDLGVVTDGVRQNVSGSELVILESNHDLQMLATGSYPPDLQARIRSDKGHLSNAQSAAFAAELAATGTKHFVLAHLSEENNTPALALQAAKESVFARLGVNDVLWTVASQNAASEVIEL